MDFLYLVFKTSEMMIFSFRFLSKPLGDFYVEITWELGAPVACMCPSETYWVFKRGSSVRVDTTLLGFDQNT